MTLYTPSPSQVTTHWKDAKELAHLALCQRLGAHTRNRENVWVAKFSLDGQYVLPSQWPIGYYTCVLVRPMARKGFGVFGRPITHGHTPCHHPSPFAVVSTAALS